MRCDACGNENAWHVVTRFDKGGLRSDCCDACGLEGAGDGVPDVYLGHIGQTFKALCDESGTPIPIQSKRHKKAVMDELGVREHPDRLKCDRGWIEGTREHRRRQFDNDRPQIRETLKRWKERHG